MEEWPEHPEEVDHVIDDGFRYLPAKELERFLGHPENGMVFEDWVFYGEKIDWFNKKAARVTGELAFDKTTSANVIVDVFLPSTLSHLVSLAMGRQSRGQMNYTITSSESSE